MIGAIMGGMNCMKAEDLKKIKVICKKCGHEFHFMAQYLPTFCPDCKEFDWIKKD